MHKLLLYKMIDKALQQYQTNTKELPPYTLEELINQAITLKKLAPTTEIHEIIQDVVYAFITDSPYLND